MNQSITIESLLVIGIGAISAGVEKVESNLQLGTVLVLIGIALIGVRYFLKSKNVE
jgi:hypothetical protein